MVDGQHPRNDQLGDETLGTTGKATDGQNSSQVYQRALGMRLRRFQLWRKESPKWRKNGNTSVIHCNIAANMKAYLVGPCLFLRWSLLATVCSTAVSPKIHEHILGEGFQHLRPLL